jgi:hypothetical protein
MKVHPQHAIGKTTATAVLNAGGFCLLPQGILLTEKIVAALIKQHIAVIDIVDDSNGEAEKLMSQKKEYVEKLFAVHTNSLMQELKECLIQHMN